eukprot:gnl/TRDRNA2_/TRDRNA2_145041_c0_seq3.p1 gnl/TRDRNA2_/TRDRNA2_145041_c0~~gnl/TRDRNA2_/TRDRNA2_145041_c0_seq3.p1  ORF type:complete len:279 (-),score=51.95 gnl/TRDRNA2_/TRDRNA2_145041_c0_seq3:108-944(-)
MANVFVRGFDFGTDEAKLKMHFGTVGQVTSIEMLGKGECVLTFSTPMAAEAAVKTLDKTKIAGNSRYVDVKMDVMRGTGKRTSPDSASVFVRGFDFGTTDEQFEGHMSQAGTIERVQWCTKGSAIVTFSSMAEAENAIELLSETTIPGNSRYIDLMLKEDDDERPAKRHKGAGKGVVAAPQFQGKAAGKGKGSTFGALGDPPGSGRVFVRGFDFGTEEEEVVQHMGGRSKIAKIHWVSKGSMVIVFKRKVDANMAVKNKNSTTIPGNSRYLEVEHREM